MGKKMDLLPPPHSLIAYADYTQLHRLSVRKICLNLFAVDAGESDSRGEAEVG